MTTKTAPYPRWIAYEKNAAIVFGQVRTETDRNICLTSGGKVPHRRVWLAGLPPPHPALREQIIAAAAAIQIEDLWRAANEQTLSLAELTAILPPVALPADEPVIRQLAVLQAVLENPIYFRRRDNRISPVAGDIVQQALKSIRRRVYDKQLEQDWLRQLESGDIPLPIKEDMPLLLYKPDRGNMTHRVLKKHLAADGAAFARFFIEKGMLRDELDYLRQDFERRWPAAADIAEATLPPPSDLPRVEAPLFSIDDEGTVEIDDAFSVQAEADGGWRVGIHIAAPALLLNAETRRAARQRHVSVYFPDKKYCMLPPAAVAACSLSLTDYRPVLSLYVSVDMAGRRWRGCETVLEMARLSAAVTPAQVDAGELPPAIEPLYRQLAELTTVLPMSDAMTGISGYYKIDVRRQQVSFRPREGVARVVEVLMRLTNSLWAEKIAAASEGGLYRADSALRLTPSTSPYMWLTSPLRRYVDLANQSLLLAVMDKMPPPEEHWGRLRRSFDQQYSAARRHQRVMDMYWLLRILRHNTPADTLVDGKYIGSKRVQLADYPLKGSLVEVAPMLAVDSAVKVTIYEVDLLRQRLWLKLAADRQ